MSNAYRTQFNEAKVLEVLNKVNPKLWFTFRSKHKMNKIWMLQMIRSYELGVKQDLQEGEQAILTGDSDWQDFLKGAPRCSLNHGYQGYVNTTVINKWK